jgi:hypothetical protein
MNTRPGGLRLLCPRGCVATLTVPMLILATIPEVCSAILEDHPTMYVVGNRAPDLTTTRTSPSSTPTPTRPEWSTANRRWNVIAG